MENKALGCLCIGTILIVIGAVLVAIPALAKLYLIAIERPFTAVAVLTFSIAFVIIWGVDCQALKWRVAALWRPTKKDTKHE